MYIKVISFMKHFWQPTSLRYAEFGLTSKLQKRLDKTFTKFQTTQHNKHTLFCFHECSSRSERKHLNIILHFNLYCVSDIVLLTTIHVFLCNKINIQTEETLKELSLFI